MGKPDDQLAQATQLSQMLIDVVERAKSDFAEIAASFGLPVPLARAICLLDTPAPMRDIAAPSSSASRMLKDGMVPTTPAQHWAVTSSGPDAMNIGAPITGKAQVAEPGKRFAVDWVCGAIRQAPDDLPAPRPHPRPR